MTQSSINLSPNPNPNLVEDDHPHFAEQTPASQSSQQMPTPSLTPDADSTMQPQSPQSPPPTSTHLTTPTPRNPQLSALGNYIREF
ncbi:hypothetical protein OCU04_006659 [Sclerotinia nivalis]|uniref:Uncharacterized protein n=1 Tax=Sclerotinia nivalis TaxID=352851 RepID=A0A9X0AL31_9HELO|nr:hypothetical protein OCU04_006659 [Sclerotinia nivalis]